MMFFYYFNCQTRVEVAEEQKINKKHQMLKQELTDLSES